MHELDNRQPGATKVRGIYQWVDKKYKARIFNYGKRLLYDVVVPEPAAFLIDSLKKAVQPESFQLTKPSRTAGSSRATWMPSNYDTYASRYGVTGSVRPPPDEFDRDGRPCRRPGCAEELSQISTERCLRASSLP